MKAFFMTLLVGVSLSMDAFSLALVYGTQKITNKDKKLLSIIVGLYHFIMPIIGLCFGKVITKYLIINVSVLMAIIFFLIGIEMIISSLKENKEKILLTIIGYLFFGLSVSIDSLTTGIGLTAINNNFIEVALIFAIVSFSFTYLGLNLGNKLNEKFGKISTIIGGFVLILLAIIYFLK